MMERRTFVVGATALMALPAAAARTQVQVWKSPDCGCCKDWVAHLESNGFAVQVRDEGNTQARVALGMPDQYGSCHTARVGHYAVEGHVPAREIRRLVKERPDAVGLAVPGMPVGSPGMDSPSYGGRRDAYDVLLVLKDGSSRVYARYPASGA